MDSYKAPKKIITFQNVEHVERLLKTAPMQASLENDGCSVMKKGGFVILDFGAELNGGIAMTTQRVFHENGFAKCRIVFGESVMEALSTIGWKNATNDHSIRDTVIDVAGRSTFSYGSTGFRFVKIEAVDSDIEIREIRAKTDIRELTYHGSFECNDEYLNEIWRVGAYTVQLNMHEYLWDGAKRDRLVWVGDMHPEVSTIRMVFGDDACVRNSLNFVKEMTKEGEWMNKTATYSMWWMIIQYDLYMHWGKIDILREQKECLENICKKAFVWLETYIPDNGMEGFVDWSTKYDMEGEEAGRKAIFSIALNCAAKLFGYLGEEKIAAECEAHAQKLQQEKQKQIVNKRMSALTVLAGRDTPEVVRALEGDSAEEMSTFMGYYVLRAKAMLGDYTDALTIIRKYWGAMLGLGATTFWEDFDIKWIKDAGRIDEIIPEGKKDVHGDYGKCCYSGFRHSLCHGWASGPTPFLMEQIGGIEILEPGCKKMKIVPKLGDLEWIRVKYPTPYGILKLYAKKEKDKVITEIDAPKEIEIIQ